MKKLYRCPDCKEESYEKNEHTSEFIGLVSPNYKLGTYDELMKLVEEPDEKINTDDFADFLSKHLAGAKVEPKEDGSINVSLGEESFFNPEDISKAMDFGTVESQGRKFDGSKPRWDLLPLETIEEMVQVLTHGAEKYEPNNWQKVEGERYFAALMRHLKAYQSGEELDQESGLHHLAHAMTNVMFLLWKVRNDK